MGQEASDLGVREGRPKRQLTIRRMMGLVAILALPLAAISWVSDAGRRNLDAARNAQCVNNLKRHRLALGCYEATYGCLPAASTAGRDGEPVYSWRVASLGIWTMDEPGDRYEFSVTWDDPRNAPLGTRGTSRYHFSCPSGDGHRANLTDYVAVVGPHTAWPEGRGLKFSEITDDPASTILLIEVAGSGIHWMKPTDITLDDLLARGPSSSHPAHFTVLLASGSVRRLRKDIDRATLKALLTIDGGEAIDPDSW
jgi:hypothetical protein